MTNELGFVLTSLTGAARELAATMDKHGTSAVIAGIGVILMAFCLATRVEAGWADFETTEFIVVFVIGCIFTLIGVVARLYVGIKATDAYRGELQRRVQRAERLEEAGRKAQEDAADKGDRAQETVPRV